MVALSFYQPVCWQFLNPDVEINFRVVKHCVRLINKANTFLVHIINSMEDLNYYKMEEDLKKN